jgi:L-histidine N-alpha-methyltransferase
MSTTATRISDRFELVTFPRNAGEPTFGQEIAAGLRSTPKRLSPKFLYDDVGSALFEAITHLPEYYPTRAETDILREWGWEMVRLLDAPLDFLELGSGSAVKTRILIEEALRVQRTLKYSPIDISVDALRSSSQNLVDSYAGLSVRAYAGDYFDVLGSGELRLGRKTLAMFMGSNIGNYEPADALRILGLLARVLRPGDGLLLGTDLKKDRATLELAYDDPAGVTAAFDRNVLSRINRELGGDFSVRDFEHVVRYDESRGAVDSFLEASRDMKVSLAENGVYLNFARGERIHVESSYKFSDEDIKALAEDAGFRVAQSWTDGAEAFCVSLLVRLAS